MQKQLILKPKSKLLSGMLVPVILKLGTLRPVTIDRVAFSKPARLLICDTQNVQQGLINSRYQMMQPTPVGVLFHLASNVIWLEFDFTKPPLKAEQVNWMRYPQGWERVTVQSLTGSLPCVIEARSGNEKHKADIEIVIDFTV